MTDKKSERIWETERVYAALRFSRDISTRELARDLGIPFRRVAARLTSLERDQRIRGFREHTRYHCAGPYPGDTRWFRRMRG